MSRSAPSGNVVQSHFTKFKSDMQKKLHEKNQFNDFLERIEQKTGIDRFFMVVGMASLFALYMIFGQMAELVCNLLGFVYPAYCSIKAIESRDKADDTQWLTYWVVFAFFACIDFAGDEIFGWFPLYYLAKCVLLLWLCLPMTRGAELFYDKAIRPVFARGGAQPTVSKQINQAYDRVADAAQGIRNDINAHQKDF